MTDLVTYEYVTLKRSVFLFKVVHCHTQVHRLETEDGWDQVFFRYWDFNIGISNIFRILLVVQTLFASIHSAVQ